MVDRKALVVGIDSYPHNPLNNCVSDAEEIAGLLEQKEYGFEVVTLFDEKADRRSILSALHSMFTDDSSFITFYFAGHGISNRFTTYLVPFDTDTIDVGIDLDYIKQLVVSRQDEHVPTVIILDCCHSGAANIRGDVQSNLRYITNNDLDQKMHTLGAGNVLLAACQPHEVAYEKPSIGHGVFSYYLLEGMYGEAVDSNGEITIPNLYDYVSHEFEAQVDQTPVFKGDIIGRIVFGRDLTPRERSRLPGKELERIGAKAQSLMNEYIQSTSASIEDWKTSVYRDACSLLEPRLRWFGRQVKRHPELNVNYQFGSAYSTAQSKLADLGHLQEGFDTRLGIVEKKIGAGTFGTVWLLNTDDGRIAYKVYHPLDLDKPEKLHRFNRGYRAMEQLDHSHIVKVRKFTDCPIGFSMQYIDGPNSRNFVHQIPHVSKAIVHLLTVGETLTHAHSRSVRHRDVKPENIIMGSKQSADGDFRPYLTDFDLAWFSTATQFTREGFGSLIYAAPEQLANPKSPVAHAATTDVYAFGQLCFFFICKHDPVPMLADNARALQKYLESWRLEKPARRLVELYELCTKQKPGDRIQDFREICDRLYEIQQLLEHNDHTAKIKFQDFARQLIFSIVGMSPERQDSDTSFYTTSGQTHVSILATTPLNKTSDIHLEFQAQNPPIKHGANGFQEVRRLINRRIDESLREFDNVQRRAGKTGVYKVLIIMQQVPLSIDGVEICRQIAMRVVGCIEGS